ncbi:4201_t:CDS:2 [Ambispora gerdemannii]|uniref:Cytochrome c oxidase subunit 6, mitochondrial n=1 Tax=Ambispora gerdemannii TaxID=144530 RepID=A0A9N8VUW9_9GLOM|nr:4201_t:CDS:2 [Ambispora gerdemannii]
MNRLQLLTRAILTKPLSVNTLVAIRSPPSFGRFLAPNGSRSYSSGHEDESFEAFTERYVKLFEGVDDLFELQRNLNNCFAYDLVPAPSVIEAALKAARRVNDFPTAVRIFEGLKEKVENTSQYEQYLEELKPVRNELGVLTKDELGLEWK